MLKLNYQLQYLGGLVTELATTYKTIFWGLGSVHLYLDFIFKTWTVSLTVKMMSTEMKTVTSQGGLPQETGLNLSFDF